MKFEDLKLVQKWREYAGPKDERLEAESAKIYKIGFVLLSFGMLMLFFYQFIARQVAWVHSDASEMPHGFATPFEAAMYLWLVLVMLICAGLQTRKGYVDTNRFGQTEYLPVGYFLLLSGLSGAAFALVIATMRCIAEAHRTARKRLLVGEPGNGRGVRRDHLRCRIRRAVLSIL